LVAPWLTLFSRARFEVERNLPKFGSVGAKLNYQLRVKNLTRRAQRGIFAVDDLPDPRPSVHEFCTIVEPGEERRNLWDRRYLYYRWSWLMDQSVRAEVDESECPDMEPGEVVSVSMNLVPTRRGRLRLEQVAFGCAEPFGLFRSVAKANCPGDVMILPKRYPVDALALPGERKYQPGGVALAGDVGESEEFVALRDYRPGDPLKKVHWRSSARCGRPIVKEFVDEFFVRHGLILDTFTDRPFSAEFEEAVSIAASFACTVKDRDSLLDLLVIGPTAFTFTSGRGVGQEEKMLEVLAGVKACSDQPFRVLENLVLAHDAELSGCLCVLLEWDDDRQRMVTALRRRSIPVKVLVVRPAGDTATLPLGAMADAPNDFHLIPTDRTGVVLAGLGGRRNA
jgi:uncharacterized protein (DUF58 family)